MDDPVRLSAIERMLRRIARDPGGPDAQALRQRMRGIGWDVAGLDPFDARAYPMPGPGLPNPTAPAGDTTYGIAIQYHPSFTPPYTPIAGATVTFRSPFFAPYDYDDVEGTTGADGTLSFAHPTVSDWVTFAQKTSYTAVNYADNRRLDGTAGAPLEWRQGADSGYLYFFSQSHAPVVWNGYFINASNKSSRITTRDRSGAAETALWSDLAATNQVLFGFGHTSAFNEPGHGTVSHRYRLYGMTGDEITANGAALLSVQYGYIVSSIWFALETGSMTAWDPDARTATFHFTTTHTWDGAALGDMYLVLT